ncbi:metallophosphoesterase family protein [Halocella sp. SP3-1]|uniref:metallophosphoesterase n=1 Tax=Halocella sp. SP3-1 TaxID=2382161 RepID=UPI000F750FDC|nr:metallophosphoesterase family protein [Halocella sp. SP3-1]AZO93666.1 metallophosphatase family protein [Halocella sp. SP3-1]
MLVKELIDRVKKGVKKLTDKLYILDELRESSEKKILHISDTPDLIYPFIFEAIDRLRADVVIHTGDLADNVKLGSGAPLDLYKQKAGILIEGLVARQWADIYIVPGNHDAGDFIEGLGSRVKIMEEGSLITVNGIEIGLAHYGNRLPEKADIKLYGHNLKNYEEEGTVVLNGIMNISVILIPSLKIYPISYPLVTAQERKYKRLKLP